MVAMWNKKVASFRRDERGSTALLFAMALVPATLLSGGSIDYGRVLAERAKLQAASDAASAAAAGLMDVTSAERSDMATKVFKANLGNSNLEPEVVVDGDSVKVSISRKIKTPFLQLAAIPEMDAYATSTAFGIDQVTNTPGGKVCLLALDPNSDDGIHIQGSNRINYENCWAHTNSSKATAINGNGNALANGAGNCAVGSWVAGENHYTPTPKPNCLAATDPFATVGAYEASGTYTPTFTPPAKENNCKASNLNLKKGTFTLDPGRYCGGIEMQAGAVVTFNPGVYYIDNGNLKVQSGSSAMGQNVVFYLEGASSKFELLGGGTIDLAARTTGSSYAGFLLIMHPNANHMGTSTIQGGGVMKLQGMMYAPTQRIEVSGNGDVNTSDGIKVFSMAAKDFYFRGNGIFNLKKHADGDIPDLMQSMPVRSSRKTVIKQ
jgi:Flp pilus assembly protein TadG